jgi:8-oxo-dGTP pyrophosphatase MutT (NUDIX family)
MSGQPTRWDPLRLAADVRRAATVVLLRPSPGGRECFMLRRSGASRFMPDTLVFPGGRLDPEDGDPSDPTTWARAAARECLEEAKVAVDPARLRWFDTWCTPSAEPRRFLARFFVVELREDEGAEAEADGSETTDGRWWTAELALAAWEANTADLPPPTICTLLRLQRGEIDRLVDADPSDVILPKATITGDTIQVVMPHDAAYASMPGDTAEAPHDRLVALPTRFSRTGTRWSPA